MNLTECNWPSVPSAAIRRVSLPWCVEPPGLRRTGLVAVREALIPVMLLAWLGLGILTHFPVQAAPAEPEAAAPAVTHTADLQYQETDEVLLSRPLGTKLRTNPFLKEPALPGQNVFRGSLLWEQRPDKATPLDRATAFIWDKGQGRLYLDLNGNGDLTDDPKAVFASSSRGDNQSFTNIHLVLPTLTGDRAVRLQLECYSYQGRGLRVIAGLCCFWDAKVSLHSTDWQLGLVEGDPREKTRFAPEYLLLRSWAERQRPFHLTSGSPDFFEFTTNLFFGNAAYALVCDDQPGRDSGKYRLTLFTTNLFFGNAAYALVCDDQPGRDSGKYRLTLKEQSPRLGEVKITGANLHRVILTAKPASTVVLDQPQGIVKLPVGNYSLAEIWLRKGEVEVGSFGAGKISVDGRRPASLVAGGPLTNSVAVKSQDHTLQLSYKMLGADGRGYKFPRADYKHPPEFAVFQGTNRLATGKFQYG
jgi:hypothetical protein